MFAFDGSPSSSFPSSTSPSSVYMPTSPGGKAIQPTSAENRCTAIAKPALKLGPPPLIPRRLSEPPKGVADHQHVSKPHWAPPILQPAREFTPPLGVNTTSSQSSPTRAFFQQLKRRSLPSFMTRVHRNALDPATTRYRPLYYKGERNESRCMQIILPGLYVAFEDDASSFHGSSMGDRIKSSEQLRTSDGLEFTHVVELRHAPLGRGVLPQEEIRHTVDQNTRIQTLHLTIPGHASYGAHRFESHLLSIGKSLVDRDIPPPQRDMYFLELDSWTETGIPLLTNAQFTAAREFLHSSRLDVVDPMATPEARLLITTPRDDRTDALCVLSLYLASESGNTIWAVLNWIEEKRRCLSVWKGVVSPKWAREVGNLPSYP